MRSKILQVENHTIETLTVYPRVHYFQRRYHDLISRFKKISGVFPKNFQDEKLIKDIDDISDNFTKKLVVSVIGNCELDLAHIVVSTKPSEKEMFSELKEPPRISLFICHSKSERLDESGLKSITSVIDKFYDDFGKENPHLFENMFVVIDTEQNHSDEERNTFREEVNEVIRMKLQDTDEKPRPDRVIFGSSNTVLGSRISELLETMLVDGFHKVKAYFDRFVQKTKQYDSEIDIIHTDLLVKAIHAFLDDIGLADMRQIAENDHSKETEGMSVDEKFLQLLLKKLARLVKCAVVEPCASKYNIPPWVVNLLLDEIQFEQKLAESVSKNTRHHLRKLNDITEEILKTHEREANTGRGKHSASLLEYFIRLVSYKFDFIVYPLQNDMSKVISDAEKTMASAGRIIIVMGKMMFEIEGYLRQTIIEKYEPKPATLDVPKELRDAILELKGVYGTGKVYDVFEIHVQEQTPSLKEDVSTLMRKYGYTQPYKVKTVKKEPVKMMADIQHENGKLIRSPYPGNKGKYREGTLGCFAENDKKKLYVLTCAHVVENPDKEKHDVLIRDRALRLKKIGKSTRTLTICSGEGDMPVIDIAAVTVNDDFERQCICRMKDESGLNRTSVIVMEPVPQLVKRFIQKHASKSGCTKGIICSSDYSLSSTGEDDYLLMIESLPGSDNGCFAERGESGAIICTSVSDTIPIEVVVMSNKNYYKLVWGRAAEKYLHFLCDSRMIICDFDFDTDSMCSGGGADTCTVFNENDTWRTSRYQDILLTNKGAHAYNGNGPTNRSDQSSTSTTGHQTAETNQLVSRNERLRTCPKNTDKFAPKNREKDIKSGINKRKRGDSTEMLQDVKRRHAEVTAELVDACTQYDVNETSDSDHYFTRIPSEKEIGRMAHRIGREYRALALELDLTQSELCHIEEENKYVVDRIIAILLRWRVRKAEKATFGELAGAMGHVNLSHTIVFDEMSVRESCKKIHTVSI